MIPQSASTGVARSAGLFLVILLALAGTAFPQGYYESGSYCAGTSEKCFGDPVDVGTGAFRVLMTLARIPGRVPMSLSWEFRSQDPSPGPLGVGTSLSTDFFLHRETIFGIEFDGYLYTPGNRHFTFFFPRPDGTFGNQTDPEVLGATVRFTEPAPSQASILRWKSGDRYIFDAQARLSRIEDRHGNAVTISRNTRRFPTEMRQAGGRSITFLYDASGKLVTVTVPEGRNWQFNYDAQGRLIRATDPSGASTQYTWTTYKPFGDPLPLVQTVIDRNERVRVTNAYDDVGRIISQTYADGGVLRVAYSGSTPEEDGSTTVTDPQGNVTRWDYAWTPGLFGYLTSQETDPLGRATTYERADFHFLPTRIEDFRGRRTTLQWDQFPSSNGNLLSITRPTASGGTANWSYTYDPVWNRLTSATDPLLRQTRFTVDPDTGNITEATDPRNSVTRFAYAPNGDLISITNALNQTTRYEYSADGDLVTIIDPLDQRTEYTYDAASRRVAVRDANSKTVQIAYDALDRIASLTQTLEGRPLATRFQYDAEGNLRFLTDAKDQTWEWVYDPLGRVIEDKNPLGQSALYTWDRNGNLLSWTDRLGQRGEYSYGPGDRLAAATFRKMDASVESSLSLVYDPTSRLLESLTDSLFGTYSWAYDAIDRITGRNGPNGNVAYTLDDLGRRTATQAGAQERIDYQYDANDKVVSITQGLQTYGFAYDALDRLTERRLPNTVSSEWTFNPAGFLTAVVSKRAGKSFDNRTYRHDPVGSVIEENAGGTVNQFVHDDLYRLVSANVRGAAYGWTYDDVGNRLSETVDGATTPYSYGPDNRLSSVGKAAVTLDANGNLLSQGADTYTWDVRGRLAGLTRSGATMQFTHDPLGIRAGKTVAGATTAYLLDGADVVSETTGGKPVHTLHGPLVDQPLARGGLYFTPDHLGSTTTLSDGAGDVVQQYSYSPFGAASRTTGVLNPFQFTGRENDDSGLYYYRARYYSPQWGRFISQDPIEFRSGSINHYAYVDNQPWTLRDPSGLQLQQWTPPSPGKETVQLNAEAVKTAESANSFSKKLRDPWKKSSKALCGEEVKTEQKDEPPKRQPLKQFSTQ